MTIRECYEAMGADFDGVMSRLLDASRVSRFAGRFCDDGSYDLLISSMASGDIETAFRASHTLKGTCANLGLTDLNRTASAVCEELRHGNPGPGINALVDECTKSYEMTVGTIRKYLSEKTD